MEAILLYLAKAHVALLLFAAAYFGLLRRLTFFTLNRVYLIAALLFAAVYPALPIPALLPAKVAEPVVVVVQSGVTPAGPAITVDSAPFNWQAVALTVYGVGVILLLGRLLLQLLSVRRLRRISQPAIVNGHTIRMLPEAVSPFSFGQTIYVNPTQHSATELAAVLTHERVHVRQWHTLDVLVAQVVVAAAWCNPAAWLLRRAILDNLEYLADRAVLHTGLDRQTYQVSLLRLSHSMTGPTLVSPFTFSTLKNRVVMMNTPFSSTGQLVRYVVAGPLVLAVALGLSAARAQSAGPVVTVAVGSQTERGALPIPSVKQQATELVQGSQAAALVLTGPATTVTPTAETNQLAPRKSVMRPTQRIQPAEAKQSVSGELSTATNPVSSGLNISQAPDQSSLYYVDGQLYTGDINAIKPSDIASVNVFKGENARQLFGDKAVGGVVVITTKQGYTQPEVRAFNEKIGAIGAAPVPAEKPDRVAYLAAPALAYIVKNYPTARLTEVSEVLATDNQTPQYRAEIVIGKRPLYLLFDAQGEFISTLPYNRFTR